MPDKFVGTIHIPLATDPISLNKPLHWAVVAKHTKQWRTFCGLMAKRFPKVDACDVTLTWFVKDNRRRDSDNLARLGKACFDGIVDAGVVKDDTPQYMGKSYRIVKSETGNAYMELEVRER
jgi:crossover junction endodeoxyribonuclease RusA